MPTLAQALDLALRHHQAGDLPSAEAIYRQILQADPNHADAHHLLGVLAYQLGRYPLAIDHLSRAIAIDGGIPAFHNNLAKAYHAQCCFPEAIAAYQRALSLKPGFADAAYNLGNIFNELGQIDEAAAAFRRAVEHQPDFAWAHNNLANTLQLQGLPGQAIPAFRRALELMPDFAEAHYNLGNVLNDQGQLDDAVASLRRAIEIKPDFAAAHNNLGSIYKEQRRLEPALACFRRALALNPSLAEAHNNLGAILNEQGHWAEALPAFRRALELNPNLAAAHDNLGKAFKDHGLLDEAIASFRRLTELRPASADAHYHLGSALKRTKYLAEAIASLSRAIELKPDFAEAHNNLGVALQERGNLPAAIASFRRALDLNPDFTQAHSNMGLSLMEQGNPDAAVGAFRRALELDPEFPEACYNLAGALLLLGRFREGWARYESRLDLFPRPKLPAPRWSGKPAEGQTILLHCNQGYGDSLHFFRYAPLVRERARAARVIVQCPPALARLFTHSAPDGVEILARPYGSGSPSPECDWQLPLLSAPFALGLFEPLPLSSPCLRADPALRAAWSDRLTPAVPLRVGLAWKGNPEHDRDRLRSIPGEKLLPLAQIAGARFYSLQIGAAPNEIEQLAAAGILDLAPQIGDFADTAALAAELDLIISVDTALVHLAGALGRPVWTLLPFAPDWRWGLHTESTPWYPAMRLFRQPAIGDWDAVLARITAALPLFHPHPAAD